MIIVRGVDSDGASSMISWDSVLGGGNLDTLGSGDSLGRTLFIAIFAFAVIAFGVWVAIQQKVEEPFAFDNITTEGQDIPPPIDDEPLEATIVEELTDDTSS